MKNIDLTDERIFGNDAGDDEDPKVLDYYYYERQEFRRFYDPSTALRIVKARKGTGKSSLLKRTELIARRQSEDDFFVVCKGPELAPDFSVAANSNNPVMAWQRAICARINREIGSKIKLAMDDASISLVEAAEIDGFRGRNVVSALSDRLLKKLPVPGVDVGRERLSVGDEIQLLRRFSDSEKHKVWLIVDDIDATYRNNELNRITLAAFFSACRDLSQKLSGLIIRAAVRTDVWTLLRGADEALDKCDQYVFNLRWSIDEVAYILVNKVDAYFNYIQLDSTSTPARNENIRKEQAFLRVFPYRYPWGREETISTQKYLALHSQGRPRWTAKLCRAAALKAYERGHQKVEEGDVKFVFPSYSSQRRLDLVGEHSSEYQDFNGLLQVFSGWQRKFKTQEMLARISSEHLKKATGDAAARNYDAVQLAHLLFRSGALTAVSGAGKKAQRLDYEDAPTLLTSRADLDEGYEWEIPLFLRPALKMYY